MPETPFALRTHRNLEETPAMPAPKKYPDELRERATRFAGEVEAEYAGEEAMAGSYS
jgi:hypothetical protein